MPTEVFEVRTKKIINVQLKITHHFSEFHEIYILPVLQCFVKKYYRKFGADVASKARQAKFTLAYDRRKNMDVIGAILFNAPINNTHYKKVRRVTVPVAKKVQQNPLHTICTHRRRKTTLQTIQRKHTTTNTQEINTAGIGLALQNVLVAG